MTGAKNEPLINKNILTGIISGICVLLATEVLSQFRKASNDANNNIIAISVINEKVKVTQEDIKEMKLAQKESDRKLTEIYNMYVNKQGQ